MYVPQNGDAGLQLLLVALRDYLAADVDLMAMLPEGGESIIPEGFMTAETPMPSVMFTNGGDGTSDESESIQVVRLILYIFDKGRGYYAIEQLVQKLRDKLNTKATLDFLTFPPGTLTVLQCRAKGTTASGTQPNWGCEYRGIYIFLDVMGLNKTDY